MLGLVLLSTKEPHINNIKMAIGLHHAHSRKRIHKNLEPFPHPDKFKNTMDKLIYAGGLLAPIVTIPQLYKIWIEKNAAGVSVISWSAFLIAAIFWITYGVAHKTKPIIFVYSILAIIEILIIIGTLLYA
jgi:uncharacterized protein with PQ loop repeat